MGMSGQGFSSQPATGWLRWDALRAPGFAPKKTVAGWSDWLLSNAVRRLDLRLRHRQGIIEFTSDPACILRLSAHHAEGDFTLRDRVVRRGERLGEIHLWNEHILPMTRGGANIMWGAAMRRRLRRSLECLADFVERDEAFADVEMFRGEVAFGPGKDLDRTRCFASGFGFEITVRPENGGLGSRLAATGQTIFLWAMMHTFNRGSLRSLKRLTHPTWLQLWMSRDTLLTRYAARHAEIV